ncbi:MAG: signal peptidase II [Endomicrobium sp.]|jgi:signal peptidase II|nr:signal peptidase II [Endomicrobium sp.]
MKKIILLSMIIVMIDQLAKFFINKFVCYASSIKIISFLNFFNITNIHNSGVVFGIFKEKNLLFSILILFLLTIILILFSKNFYKINKIRRYAFCFMISGGTGNLIDRFLYGGIIDFFDFGICYLRWPSFNVADICICISIILVFIDILNLNSKRV